MSLIHVLDDDTINKIAAGEVVERPASVIKELIENAMDAGADRIEVEIMAGGTSFMRVTDNGKGMSKEDASLAIRRHATSKIREVSDLITIETLGFRGEALPTMASVSRFTLFTRQKGDDLGTRVNINGGQEPEISETGCSIGTTVKVEDLFFNTPARKKFLKTNHTEGSKINEFILKLALSRPDIELHFINNNKVSVVTPGNGNLFDTIQAIYGANVADSLLTLHFESEDVTINGYITKPSMLRSSRSWQTLIVNSRIIQNRAISKAIDNAYRSLIPKSGFPLTVLKIEVPQRTIDVNVHPQKNEVKFEDEGILFKAVYKAVIDAIRPTSKNGLDGIAAVVERPRPSYTMDPMAFVPATEPAQYAISSGDWNHSASNTSRTPQTVYEAVYYPQSQSSSSFAEVQMKLHRELQTNYPLVETREVVADSAVTSCSSLQAVDSQPEPDSECSKEGLLNAEGTIIPIGQVDLTYIIAQDAKGLYIIDQHAAHERILFDRLSAMADYIPSQPLLVHQLLTFDRKEVALVKDNQELFAKLGFHMESAGDMDYRLLEIPVDVPASEAEDIIREILTAITEMHVLTAKEIRQHCLATTACRSAIKAGEELSFKQMQILLEELAHTPFPYTCPHGRPTILKFSSEELAKMFKRTGFGF